MPVSSTPVEVFYSYAHEDASWLNELEKHLSLLRRQGLLTAWHDRHILPGADWAQAIDEHLERASVILLLISAAAATGGLEQCSLRVPPGTPDRRQTNHHLAQSGCSFHGCGRRHPPRD